MADVAEDIESHGVGNTSWVRTAKDLFAGAAGGIAQVLLGELKEYMLVFVLVTARLYYPGGYGSVSRFLSKVKSNLNVRPSRDQGK